MAVKQTGTTISLTGSAFYKGTETHNGMLLDMHENCIKYGYSQLLNADGTDEALVEFGSGVWLDSKDQNNRVYAGIPTTTGATPIFAGILEREPAISDAIVWNGKELASHQNGIVVVDGLLQYKQGKVFNTGVSLEDVSLATYIYAGYMMAVSSSNGSVYFTPQATILENPSDLIVGKVLRTNKEVGYVDVYVSPTIWGGITGTATITSFVAGTTTSSTVPTTITCPVKSILKFYYKKTADTDWIEIDNTYETTYNTTSSAWTYSYEFGSLDSATSYDLKVIASTPNGLATSSVTATTL